LSHPFDLPANSGGVWRRTPSISSVERPWSVGRRRRICACDLEVALALERMRTVDAVLFDKTGTLTKGQPAVVGIVVAGGEDRGGAHDAHGSGRGGGGGGGRGGGGGGGEEAISGVDGVIDGGDRGDEDVISGVGGVTDGGESRLRCRRRHRGAGAAAQAGRCG
jgi:hypothetical protein